MKLDDELADAEIERCRLEREILNGNGSYHISGRVACDCPECVVNGKTKLLHRPEDCSYSRARSALVDQASRIADQNIATEKIYHPVSGVRAGNLFTKLFVTEMDRLAAPLLKATSIGTLNNGSVEHNGAQNVEGSATGLNGQAGNSEHSSEVVELKRVQCWRAKTDATAAVAPMW